MINAEFKTVERPDRLRRKGGRGGKVSARTLAIVSTLESGQAVEFATNRDAHRANSTTSVWLKRNKPELVCRITTRYVWVEKRAQANG